MRAREDLPLETGLSPQSKTNIPDSVYHTYYYHQQPEEFSGPFPHRDISIPDPSSDRPGEGSNGNDRRSMTEAEEEEHHASC